MENAQINGRTYIPISWLVAALVFLVTSGTGGVFAVATIFSDVAQAKKDIDEGKDERKAIYRTLRRLERGNARIQERMGIKPESDAEENE